MLRREFSGGVLKTQLTSNMTPTNGSFTVIDGSTFPDGSTGKPFVVVIGKGTAAEEKILCSSRSGNSFTVQQRGYDDTVGNSHSVGDLVDHILDAATIQDMNKTTNDNAILTWMGL